MEAFRACFEQHFAQPKTVHASSAQVFLAQPFSPLPPMKADGALDQQEKQLLASFQVIANRAQQQTYSIQSQAMANPWGFDPAAVTSQLIGINQTALSGYEALSVDASALAGRGRPAALKQINAFIEDAKQALRTYGVVVTQNQAADAARAKILSDAGQAAVSVMTAVNEAKESAAQGAFNNMDDYIRG